VFKSTMCAGAPGAAVLQIMSYVILIIWPPPQSLCRKLASHTRLKCAAIIGGMAMQKQERLLSRNPHVVVATPGAQ
jgi:hypothetical protein